MNIRVDLSGLKLDAAIEKLQAGMLRGVKEGTELIARTAKENLQGDARGKHLMSSIHTEVAAEGLERMSDAPEAGETVYMHWNPAQAAVIGGASHGA